MQLFFIIGIALITFYSSASLVIAEIADKVFITSETFSKLILNVIVFFLAEAITVIFI